MGLIQGFLAANLFGKIVFCLLFLAMIMNWLAFTMSEWGLMDNQVANDGNRIGYGVWRKCGNQEPNPSCEDLDGWRLAWYGAFQGFAIVGFMGLNFAFFFICLALFVQQCVGNKECSIFCAISSFVSALGWAVAVIIFGVRFDASYDQGFDTEAFAAGFYLAIIMVIMAVIAGICAIIGVRGGKQVGSSSSETEDSKPEKERRRRRKSDEEQQQQQQEEEEQQNRQQQQKQKTKA